MQRSGPTNLGLPPEREPATSTPLVLCLPVFLASAAPTLPRCHDCSLDCRGYPSWPPCISVGLLTSVTPLPGLAVPPSSFVTSAVVLHWTRHFMPAVVTSPICISCVGARRAAGTPSGASSPTRLRAVRNASRTSVFRDRPARLRLRLCWRTVYWHRTAAFHPGTGYRACRDWRPFAPISALRATCTFVCFV